MTFNNHKKCLYFSPSLFILGLFFVSTTVKAEKSVFPDHEAPIEKVVDTPEEIQNKLACIKVHRDLGFPPRFSNDSCQIVHRRRHVLSRRTDLCLQKTIGTQRYDLLRYLCFNDTLAEQIISNPNFLECSQKASRNLDGLFWAYEDISQGLKVRSKKNSIPELSTSVSEFLGWILKSDSFNLDKQNSPNINDTIESYQPHLSHFQQTLFDSCRSKKNEKVGYFNSTIENDAIPIRTIGELQISSQTPVLDSGSLLGGMSDWTFKNGQLIAVTDDPRRPMLIKFNLDMSVSGDLTFNIDSYQDLLKDYLYPEVTGVDVKSDITINPPQLDLEGSHILNDGRIIVSSEIPLVDKSRYDISYEKSFLSILSDKGSYLEGISIPDKLLPKGYFESLPCKSVQPGGGNFGKPFFSFNPSKTSPNGSIDRVIVPPCMTKRWKLTLGMEPNKRIEALTVSPSETRLIYAAEGSILEEQSLFARLTKGNEALPVVVSSLDGKNIESYYYEHTTMHDNGITAIEPIDEDSYLVLERGFNAKEKEAIVKIFKISFSKTEDIFLKKTLVLDLNKNKRLFSSPFDQIDNFEAMALSSTDANGNRILFLGSDNNYSDKQRTVLLALEVSGEFLNEL